MVQDLLSHSFKRLMEEKFDTDLSANPGVILMMGNTTGHYNEGYAHPDSKHKIITVILGFSREGPMSAAVSACCAARTAMILLSNPRRNSAVC